MTSDSRARIQIFLGDKVAEYGSWTSWRKKDFQSLISLMNRKQWHMIVRKSTWKEWKGAIVCILDCQILPLDKSAILQLKIELFPGKLWSWWSGPYIISKMFSYSVLELIHPKGCLFKVNSLCMKHYIEGDQSKGDEKHCSWRKQRKVVTRKMASKSRITKNK